MEKNTLKLLGKVLRESFPIKDFRENKSLRRLIVQIERREPSAQRRSAKAALSAGALVSPSRNERGTVTGGSKG